MRHSLIHRLAASGFAAALFAVAAIPALADDFGQRFTVDVAPVFNATTTGDANSAPPAGLGGVGYTKDNPVPQTVQLEYGLDYKIDKHTHFYYAHNKLVFAIGRVLTAIPGAALVSGEINDRTDTFGINRDFGHGIVGRVYFYDHERSDVTGLCLNQFTCAGQVPNPANIDEHGYGIGGTYNFGPLTKIGSLFSAGVDAKYVPRPSIPPAPCGSCEGIGHYVASQWLFPYSITMKIPILPSHTIIPFIGYERASVLFRDETTPEVFNVTNFGIVKVLNKNMILSLVNLNFSGCRCADVVPPPDNIRFAQLLLKLDFRTGL